MMSTRDFEYKQIAFVFTSRGEKISFKNDNLLITDENGKTKHQSTCYRLFLLFICGDYCITSGLLERADKFGFNIVLMTPNLRITKIIHSAKKQLKKMKNVATIRRDKRKATKSEKKNEC